MLQDNKKIFDDLADTYECGWNDSEEELQKVRNIVEQFGIRSGMKIIEAGCGRGDFSPFILKRIGQDGLLYLVDVSDKMLDHARKKLIDYSNLQFLNQNIEQCKILSESIDMIICFNSFAHFNDKEKCIEKCNCLLKQNGILIIAHSDSREKINELHEGYGFDMKYHGLPDKAGFEKMLSLNGFDMINHYDKEFFLIKAIKLTGK